MKVNGIARINYSPNFGDALSTKQERQLIKLNEDIKKDQGYQDGINILKFYGPALPSSNRQDTGIGKLTSQEAREFYKFAKVYAGANTAKTVPLGQLTDKQVYSDNHYPGAYNRSTFSIGEDIINPFDLASEKYGYILDREDAKEMVARNKQISNIHSYENLINFGTTLGWTNQEDYPVNDILHKAFDNFKNDKNPNPELKKLREDFEKFKNQKEPVDYDDIYTRLALYPYLKDWGTAKVDFFVGFDSDPKIRAEKMPQYNKYKEQYKDEIEFYKFKQFLGHNTLMDAKNIANKEGIELFGDCPLGFSWPEEQVFPDAFLKEGHRKGEAAGWGLPVLHYYDLIQKEDSAAHKVLKAKVAHHLNYFDGIRFDVGWAYMRPSFHFGDKQYRHPDAGTKITDFIEKTAKEVKGPDFDTRKLMYECDADANDFGLYDNIDRVKNLDGMIILSTEHEKNDSDNIGWGNAAFLKENLGFKDDNIMLGPNNHDGRGFVDCANDATKSDEQIGALMRIFKLRPEDGVHEGWRYFKDEPHTPQHMYKYMRGRLAEITTVKNNFVQLNDLLAKKEKIDYHTGGMGINGDVDYKNRLNKNYIEEYHRNLQNGNVCSMIGAQKFRMEHDGTKERRPDLYARVEKFDAYLRHRGNILSRTQADKSDRANLDIEKMTVEQINRLDTVV